jgi:regulatory protein
MPTVSALRPDRRGRVAVDLDGTPWRSFPVEAAAAAGLYVGCELDRERARALARARRRAAAVDAGARALGRRALTTYELDARLARRGVRPNDRAAAAGVLGAAGHLDDARFAATRAAALADRDSGDALIQDDLEQRGLDAETIAAALAALPAEAERAAEIVHRRGRSLATARRLASRGFSPEAVDDALGYHVANGHGDAVG